MSFSFVRQTKEQGKFQQPLNSYKYYYLSEQKHIVQTNLQIRCNGLLSSPVDNNNQLATNAYASNLLHHLEAIK